MSHLLTALSAAALLSAGVLTDSNPARAWGYGRSCWYETSTIEKLSFKCNLVSRDRLGRYIYLCCN